MFFPIKRTTEIQAVAINRTKPSLIAEKQGETSSNSTWTDIRQPLFSPRDLPRLDNNQTLSKHRKLQPITRFT